MIEGEDRGLRLRRLGGGLAALSATLAFAVPAGAGAEVRLRLDDASPKKTFWKGPWQGAFRFEIGGSQTHDLRVEAVSKSGGHVVRSWTVNDVRPGQRRAIAWDGSLGGSRRAKNGRYFFKVRDEGGRLANRKRSKGDRRLGVYDHRFPVRGRHTYGDGFGAGRGHRGQDVFARCGKPLRAAHAGRVRYKGNQPRAAGRYLVINGKGTNKDYVYMHMKRKIPVREGQRVRTGQRIGRVGRTGNASGCHLHFEIWSAPGWYSGGRPLKSVTRKLRRWDGWS